jgi:hypothetical protein
MPVQTIIKLRRDTAANWASTNPVLAAGEQGLETDTNLIKYGDGATAWVDLAYPSTSTTTYLVRNNSGAAIPKGTVVGATGAEPSGRIDIAPFEVSGVQDSELRVMGVVVANISSGQNGTVMSFGTLRNVDTRGNVASALAVGDETWAEGDILYAHPTVDGKLTNVRPQHDLAIAFITVRHQSSGQIAIRIVPGNNHLEWMHDVLLDSPADNEVLAYDSATSLWKNQTAEEAGLATQTALNAKLSLTGGTMTGKIVLDGDPTQALHAVTKQYVDSVEAGLKAKPSVVAATTANLTADYANGTGGVGATLTGTANGAFPQIDGVSVTTVNGQRGVLVKNQTNAAHNGRYNLTTQGDAGTKWVLTRCSLCDESSEIPGAYVFVTDGTINGQTGWVQHVDDPATFAMGTDDIDVFQFAGAGTVTAGTNISVSGNEVSTVADPTFTSASIGNVSNTEIQYLDGVTSAIQTQLDGKTSNSSYSAKGVILVGTGSGTFVAQSVGTNGQVLTANSAQADGVEWTTPATGGASTSGTLAQFAATTSSELAGVISDETGSGALVFGTSPALSFATLRSPKEITTVSATAATGTINYDQQTQADLFYTSNASANFTLNFRGSSSVTLNNSMATGETATLVFRNTNGTTPYYANVIQIDGTTVTPKWLGGTAPSAGNASSIDVYSFVITKTGSATFTVLGSVSKFA